jgi:hypothetical protein
MSNNAQRALQHFTAVGAGAWYWQQRPQPMTAFP